MNAGRRIPAVSALATGDLAALVTLRPDGDLAGKITAPHAWVSEAGADGAAITLAGAALWCVALWLGIGLLAAVATALPGGCGRLARTLARVLLPAAVYRVVAGAASLGVLLAPVAAGAAEAGPSTNIAATSTSAPPIPTPTWPTDPPTLPIPGWPTSTTAPGGPAVATPRPDARPPHAARSTQQGHVVVRTGDSLWGIAANQLGRDSTPARTAAAWPRWYAANRAVIGADPDLIKPGQRLAPPAPTGSPR